MTLKLQLPKRVSLKLLLQLPKRSPPNWLPKRLTLHCCRSA